MVSRANDTERRWARDPFMVCLALALSIHAAVLFGITFGVKLKPIPRLADTLDVVLVQWRSDEEPEHPDYLAQADQKGGGDTVEKSRPAEPVSGTLPTPARGRDPVESQAQTPPQTAEQRKVVTVDVEDDFAPSKTAVEEPEAPRPDATSLMQQSMNMAALQPEVSPSRRWKSKIPRREFISANTRKYEFASYMSAWVSKVERVGNMNYPTDLRSKKLHGDLVLTVGIARNGSVESIDLMRSSGVPEIDRAAIEIVRLAAPYAPLPENIADRVDVLHITRTWRFESAFGVE
ncbi:MAG: TonB family protein [Lysobacterales bacterium]